MGIPWEAIVAIFLAGIGFIAWLTKISVMQDVGNDKIKDIKEKVTQIESSYVKIGDFSWLKERVENGFKEVNKRIDEINKKV